MSKKNQVIVRTLDGEVKEVRAAKSFVKPKTRRAKTRVARRTEHWRMIRAAALKRDGGRCRDCGTADGPLHVHHITYARLGEELLEDVATLCQRCHVAEHKWQARLKKNRDIEAARVFASTGKGTTLAR